MAKTFDGVMAFEILPDGCLNGTYSNDHKQTKNKIFNTIARKKPKEKTGIIGRYTCGFMYSTSEGIWECDLVIQDGNVRKHGRKCQYDFIWYNKGMNTVKFEGSGWQTGQNQITVSYRDV